jgi:Tol biopolymer transport system component
MTVRAVKFTPHVLLGSPIRSHGLPNSDASQILYSSRTYSFHDHSKKTELRILDTKSNQTRLVSEEQVAIGAVTWLGDKEILVLIAKEDGRTDILVGDFDDFSSTWVYHHFFV